MLTAVLGLSLLAARPNVLLVSVDTLRADHLGCYGSALGATPRLDRLAAAGIRFADVSSPVPLTRPAHASLLTGLYPFEHGVQDNLLHALPEAVPTLATRFRAAGYRTAAFVGSLIVARESGLARDFETFSDGAPAERKAVELLAERRAEAVSAEALEFLGKVEPPFFLWVHFYDPHAPYDAPAPYRDRFPGNAYAGEVAYVDAALGRLEDALAARGIAGSTLLVVTADHGEGLGDHGEQEHGVFVYQESLAVPLLLSQPGVLAAGSVVSEPVRLIDVAPTLLQAAGLPALPASGVSLWKRVTDRRAEPVELSVYFESLYGRLHFGWAALAGIRRGTLKYIEAPRPELYDLESDPAEKKNIFLARKAEARQLREVLEQTRVNTRDADAASPETLETLAALGYAGAPVRAGASGPDPKDKIAEFSDFATRLREAIDRFDARDFARATALFQELAKRDILSFEVHFYLARCHLVVGRLADAIREFEAASALFDGHAGLHLERGEAYLRARNPEKAREAFAHSLELAPTARAGSRLATALRQLGRYREARDVLREAVTRDPGVPDDWNELGALSLALDDEASALESFRRAAALRPEDALVQHNLGFTLERLGRIEEARACYRRALELDPTLSETRRRLEAIKER